MHNHFARELKGPLLLLPLLLLFGVFIFVGRQAKIDAALETVTNGAAFGDNPVERSDSVAVVTGQAIPVPGGVAEQAETAEDIWLKVRSTVRSSSGKIITITYTFVDLRRIDLHISACVSYQLCDIGYVEEMLSREDVQRDRAVLLGALEKIDLSDCDEDQWRL